MEPQKFRAQYKCECYGSTQCSCPKKSASTAYFMENIHDIANTLANIMAICGIHEAKAKASVDVITYSFLHYDEIRHRIDAVPRKRLCKEDLIHELGRKCLMNRMEAQLTYSIIKRAFKAFYHGTTEGGVRNRALEAELLHTQECYWVHAAKRTAQIFANYEGMFFSAQKTYEALIRCAYKKLYDRLQKRQFPLKSTAECGCKACARSVWEDGHDQRSKRDLLMYRSNIQLQPVVRIDDLQAGTCPINRNTAFICSMDSESMFLQDEATQKAGASKKSGNVEFVLPRCYQCNCPKLVCDCDVERETGVLTTDCSQGPYKCQWIRVDKDDERPDPCITIPENHQCPVDCDAVSRITCDSECICDCDSCECVNEEESSGYDDDNEAVEDEAFEANIEEEEEDGEPEYTFIDLPDINERDPTPRYGGCRVQVNHIVEEVIITNHPVSIAAVEEHINRTSIISETLKPKVPTNAAKGATPKSNNILATAAVAPAAAPAAAPAVASASELVKENAKTTKNGSKPSPAKKVNLAAKGKQPEEKPQEMTAEERRKEGEEIVKLLGQLI